MAVTAAAAASTSREATGTSSVEGAGTDEG